MYICIKVKQQYKKWKQNNSRHADDYMRLPKERGDILKVKVVPNELDEKIKELQKKYKVEDISDVF